MSTGYDCNDEISDHAMEIDSISLEDLQWSSALFMLVKHKLQLTVHRYCHNNHSSKFHLFKVRASILLAAATYSCCAYIRICLKQILLMCMFQQTWKSSAMLCKSHWLINTYMYTFKHACMHSPGTCYHSARPVLWRRSGNSQKWLIIYLANSTNFTSQVKL